MLTARRDENETSRGLGLKMRRSRLVLKKNRDVSVSSHVSVFEFFHLLSFDFVSPRRPETRRGSRLEIIRRLVLIFSPKFWIRWILPTKSKYIARMPNKIQNLNLDFPDWFTMKCSETRLWSRDLETKTRWDGSCLVSRLVFREIQSCRLVSKYWDVNTKTHRFLIDRMFHLSKRADSYLM